MSSLEPIAIVGSACRFPGSSDTPSKLWELLREPRDLLRKVEAGRRFDPMAFYNSDPEHHGTTNVKASYFLDEDPAEFDNGFFNIQPAESEAIDPQQRMLMETVYDSLCAAGQTIDGLRGSSTAVIVGLMGDDWSGVLYKDWENLPQYSATGMGRSIMSNRVSYFFDWHGPSITLDTACSSSLVAVHLAIQALRNGESKVAVAAGANLLLSPAMYIAESNLHMLSPTGRSRMWDRDVDGYARGEGIAAVVLKPLTAALKDGDHIECIIRATGVNQDGKTPGLTMPSAAAQAALIRETYARAGLDLDNPEDRPQFFHAHGTGTPAGDPQEAEAISRAFYPNGASDTDKLYVGSIKTIIGHTEGTAGLASLLGSSLALQHNVIPPNMHFNNLNPRIEPFYRGLEVPTSAKPWPKLLPGQPRRASINSFGFGGTNAHAIIEAYEPSTAAPSAGPTFTPLTISAASEKSLRALLSSYSDYVKANPQTSLRDFAYTVQERRSTLAYRAAIAASTREEALQKIEALLGSVDAPELTTKHFGMSSPRILGVFTGQGAQWPRMGAKLVEASPLVSKRLDELDTALVSLPDSDRPDWTLRGQLLAGTAKSRITEAALSQPLCTAVQILLVDLLQLAGIRLHAVVGHSSGEIGAAYAAGLLSASRAIRIAYYRGLYAKLAKSPNGSKGAMMAVGTSFEDAADFCQLESFEGRLQVAARNSSSSITLSGDEAAVAEAIEIFKDEGKFARQLKVDTAYHSAHMLPCSAPYLASMEAMDDGPVTNTSDRPRWHSSVLEGQVMSKSNLDAQYFVDNMTNTVLFAPAVTAATTQSGPFDLALEIGPHPALKGPCLDTLEELTGDRIPYSGVLSRGKDDIIELSTVLGFVWSYLGAGSVTFEEFERAVSGALSGRQLIPDLPKYPFDHSKSFWTMSRVSGAHTTTVYEPPHPILGRRQAERETSHEIQWRNILRPKEISWLKGHKIQGQIVFPAAGFVAMVVEAMKSIAIKSSIALVTIENLFIGRAIAFDDENSSVESLFSVKVVHSGKDSIQANFSCYSGAPHEPGTSMGLNAEGVVNVLLAEPKADQLPFLETEDWNMTEIEVDRFYDQFTRLEYEYTPPFHGMRSIKRKNGYATGTIEDESGSDWEDQLLIHPGMLDTALQASSAAFSCPGDGRMWGLYIPAGIQRITINPFFTSHGIGKQGTHPWEAVVRSFKNARSIVDITIFSEDNANNFIQVEGLELMPFTAARPEDDTVQFSRFDYKIDRPNGDLAAPVDDGLSAEDVENAIKAERVSFFYLRRLVETITPEEKADALPHYQRLLDWATHSVDLVRRGKNPYVPSSYQADTKEQIDAILEKYRDRVDVRMLESVGKNLPEVVRTGSSILEHMTQDGLFDFYDEGMGLDIANRHFARMAAQVSHRYPHMKVFEIGAGTGGSTRHLLPTLGSAFSTYTYTDISSGFFEAAEDRFRDYAGRMVFKSFDMERSPASQGFVEGSYDLVLASNVLHATGKLEEMMTSVRQLLKPGGYLIALELTSNDTLRVGLPMGSLPGWWVGAESGRRWGPTLSLPQWDSLLRKCGFGGIETSTPLFHKLHPSSVFAAQAVDDRLNLLRAPLSSVAALPPTDAPRLVIVGGETLAAHRIAEKLEILLAPRFNYIECVESFESLDSETLLHGSTVISITELDEPLFKTITPGKLEALKMLWRDAGTVLWVTRGARAEEPHSFMTHGLGRVVKFEYPNISLQVLDLDKLNDGTPQLLVEELLRLEVLKKWEKEIAPGDELLWSIEPEVYIESGARIIPRLYQCEQANERYNTSRRAVAKKVNSQETPILFASEGSSYELQYPSPLRLPISPPELGLTKAIRVSHFLLQTLKISSVGSLFLCAGTDESTGEQLVGLSHTAESRTTVLAEWTTLLAGADPIKALAAVAAHITASNILRLVPSGSTVVVHEPDELVGSALTEQSQQTSIRVVITTSLKDRVTKGWRYISGNFPRRLIEKALPTTLSVFVDLSQAVGSAEVGQLIARCLPQPCTTYSAKHFYGTTAEIHPGSSSSQVAQVLKAAWLVGNENWGEVGNPSVVQLQDVPKLSILEAPLTIADCSDTDVSIHVQAIDAGTIFRGDKTYFMVGMSGQVGQSLCQWMVEHGAKYVVLTSRRPKVHPEFIRSVEAMGATVRILPLDVTSKESLIQCYEEISKTMPPIAGVAQGAMVLEDSLFDRMSFEALTKVLNPKVIGTQLLDELFYDIQLDFFIVFSSLTGVVGNSGQSNYIAANMFMTALAAQRKKRGVAGSAIAISSVMGIGYVERSEDFTGDYFAKLGYRNISEQDLQQLFAEAILVGRPGCPESSEITTGLEPIYADTHVKAQFREDIKFNHFVMERPGTQNVAGRLSALPVRVQLAETKSKADAISIIKDSFIARLKRTLMISQDDTVNEKVSLVEQGIDSLMAVEVRSWFLKELEVDIPVLKILGGASITDLLTEALERVPTSVVDLNSLAGGPGKGAKPAEQTPKPAPSPPPAQGLPQVQVSSAESSSENHSSSGGSPSRPGTPLETPMTEMDEFINAVPINDIENLKSKTLSETRTLFPISEKVEIPLITNSPMPVNDTSKVQGEIPDLSHLAEQEESCAMSYGQTRFWFLNDYLEDKTSFNMTVMFKLTGKINVPQLARAVQTIGQRHEALRTRYFWSGTGEQRAPMQGILPESPLRLIHKRLGSEADAYEELRKMHNYIWDLGSWEAAKIHLLTVSDNMHFLLVSGHHISWDGYSFTVLFVDLEAAYTGKPMPPLGPECQYRAFSKWQRETYEMGAMNKTIEEFRGIIDPNTPPVPPFPFAKSQTRPVLDRFIQFEAKATLQAPLVSKLKQLARKHRATMFHLYLAALQGLVLRLLPETDDFFLGVADANRIDKNFMGSLGFFLNLLPVRFTRREKTKISDLIKDARDKAYGALKRSHVPWNVILKELKIPRTNTHAPIYQLFVDYRQVFQDRSVWGGCKLSDESWLNARNGYDLTLGITDNPTGESWLSIRLTANMYTMAGTELLMRSYVNVLETFAKGVDLDASELPAYAPSDIEAALQIGKGPQMKLEWPATISHRIDQMIERHGSEPALKDGLGNNLTYKQMGDRINVIAAALTAAGATDGSPIGVFQDPSSDWICSMLAAFRVGATYIPLDLRNSVARLFSIVQAARPTILLTDCNTTAKTETIGASNAVEIVVSDLPNSTATTPPPNRAKPGSTAVILFTSGTTGKPKGILLTHENLRAESEGFSRFCDIPNLAKVVLQQTIYSFDVSLDQIFAGLADGGCLVIVPAEKRGDPQSITKLMAEHGVTYTVATPSEYEMWFRYARENLSRCKAWRAAFGGGEHLHRGLIQEFADLALELPGLRLFNNYGPTEATLAITKGEVKHTDPDLEDHVPAGYILPNYTVAILDDHLQPVPVGVAGEICAGGPGIANGYLGLEEMTKEKFLPGSKIHPSAANSGAWYRTGDRGCLREDGAIYWLGRIAGDNQVKVRGFRIEVQEVEVVLLETAKGALSHAVVTLRGEGEQKFLAAHVVFAPDFPHHRRQEMVQHLESRLPLPAYMQPAVIVPIDDIPVTSNFKFDRKAIQAMPLPEGLQDTALVMEMEKKMAELWRRVIPHNIRELTPETNFFDVGGTSILLVKLQALVKAELNSAPLLVDLMNFSTLGGMAKIVKAFTGARVIDWETETSVPECLNRLGKEISSRPRNSSNLTVVLAGATGYLGRHLLRRLIDTPQVGEILCLVRDETTALASLSSPSGKVKFVRADLSQPNLGLSSTGLAALGEKADVVVHCAANRSFFDSYETLRPVNVESVKELARLALTNNALFHIVTSGAVQVYDGAAPRTDGSDGYVASKWAAETFLRKAARLGLQVNLHRPLPASEDEKASSDVTAPAVLDELLSIIRQLGTRPDFSAVSGYLDVAPVNQVVGDMVASITSAGGEAGSVEVLTHNARLRLHVKDFADYVDNNDELKTLPITNPLYWFADAKKAGFGYFMTSHHLVMSSKDGKLVTRR
ncbi:putative equisetin synthetase [Xylona heveae TC161]|uniref:Putative equisetin synthetase n=1 Tax=Xylona heveae (strain CBS 132557 / TC161) TaxID=1328760 RepID=A0A161U9J0_XYLHT|nr:putative equisetin synthetase [Xylona heveae TC161]KZF23885.1 putative equisetin synthetase [Xylona heveae TC161]